MAFGSWLPVLYIPDPQPIKYDQIVIQNWLNVEVDHYAAIKMPVLKSISGHRNREVYYYIKSTASVWDARIAAIYG